MAKEYIERNAVIEFFGPYTHEDVLLEPIDVINDIKAIPAADVVEVKPGRWIPVDPDSDVWFSCSECEVKISTSWNYDVDSGWNFCPCCGAKMDGGAEHG